MKESTALQRCDKKIREARKRLVHLQLYIKFHEIVLWCPPGSERRMREKLQDAKQERERVADYLERMNEWRRNNLSKLQRWAKEDS